MENMDSKKLIIGEFVSDLKKCKIVEKHNLPPYMGKRIENETYISMEEMLYLLIQKKIALKYNELFLSMEEVFNLLEPFMLNKFSTYAFLNRLGYTLKPICSHLEKEEDKSLPEPSLKRCNPDPVSDNPKEKKIKLIESVPTNWQQWRDIKITELSRSYELPSTNGYKSCIRYNLQGLKLDKLHQKKENPIEMKLKPNENHYDVFVTAKLKGKKLLGVKPDLKLCINSMNNSLLPLLTMCDKEIPNVQCIKCEDNSEEYLSFNEVDL